MKNALTYLAVFLVFVIPTGTIFAATSTQPTPKQVAVSFKAAYNAATKKYQVKDVSCKAKVYKKLPYFDCYVRFITVKTGKPTCGHVAIADGMVVDSKQTKCKAVKKVVKGKVVKFVA